MRTISFSDARSRLERVIDQVIADIDVTIITRRDAPDAVLMSLEGFNNWQKTVHLLETPANAAHLAESIRQLRTGKVAPRALTPADPSDA